ncbi:MAG TPA: IPT/TIG domain-containing protein [Gemmatimonadota bacterium]|nr:IPT/TIG domain-containing protein [Gemmatimonadota bacterium]
MSQSRRIPLALAGALLLACSGGGPSAPRDTMPPPVPDATRITASIPVAGISTVSGSSGAVEAGATVLARNTASSASAQATATAGGAFSLQVPASLGDALSLNARDAAGNEGAALVLTAGPPAASIALAAAGGAGQVGVTGRPLTELLAVRVTVGGAGLPGVPVRFTASDGTLSAATVQSDGAGSARVVYTLPAAPGAKTVRAEILDGAGSHAVTFDVEAVGAPVVESVEPAAASGGATVTITGRNFSPVPGHTTVRIGGQAAAVRSATRTEIDAIVPFGLAGVAAVEVELTGVTGGGAQIQVLAGAVTAPPVGHSTVADFLGGAGVAFVPFESGAEEYLLAIGAPSQSSFNFTLTVSATIPVQGARAPLLPAAAGLDPEAEILAHGQALLDAHGAARPRARALEPAQQRAFWVVNAPLSRYESRNARLEYDGPHVQIYVDEEVPAQTFPSAEARVLGQTFEARVYDAIRAAYGSESDIDGNGKPIVLVTPMVNVRSSSSGFVLGFFSPGDLAEHSFTNRGEIFYLMTPDPTGQWGPATPAAADLRITLARVAAHEFVHMINANERTLTRGYPGQRYWLEEGLAHYGEHVVGMLGWSNILGYLRLGAPAVSLVGEQLLTRGASTLFVSRLVERFGIEVLRRIVTNPETGTPTVASATGEPFQGLFHDWSLALYDELYPLAGPRGGFGTMDVSGVFSFEHGSPVAGNALGLFSSTLNALAASPTGYGMREGSVLFLVVRGGVSSRLGEIRLAAAGGQALQVTTLRIR